MTCPFFTDTFARTFACPFAISFFRTFARTFAAFARTACLRNGPCRQPNSAEHRRQCHSSAGHICTCDCDRQRHRLDAQSMDIIQPGQPIWRSRDSEQTSVVSKIKPWRSRLRDTVQQGVVNRASRLCTHIEIMFKNDTFFRSKMKLKVLSCSDGKPLRIGLQRVPSVNFSQP